MHLRSCCLLVLLLLRPSLCLLNLNHQALHHSNYGDRRAVSLFSTDRNDSDEAQPQEEKTSTTSSASISSTVTLDEAKALKLQAESLRQEAESMRLAVDTALQEKREKEIANIDKWIDQLLVNVTVDENTQMLNTVDQVMRLLQDERFSQEQVDKIFKRICETGPASQSRSNISPLMSLLVDAAGKLDCVEREDNPNKRWNGRVERRLRKKLFALDWDIQLEDEDDSQPGRFL